MSTSRQPYLTSRFQGFGTTVFTEMTLLAQRHDAVNLGQGFPDFDGPEAIREAAVRAIRGGHNQYCRMTGLPELNRAVAAHQQRFYGLAYDPDREVTVMNGATEALFATFQALCEVGDEVVFFEPFYDSYRACVAAAGGVEKLVTLRSPGGGPTQQRPGGGPTQQRPGGGPTQQRPGGGPTQQRPGGGPTQQRPGGGPTQQRPGGGPTQQGPDFSYDPAELERAITPKTRLILLNTPHNPTGKVFSRREIEHIAGLCRRHDLLAVTDEVYEHLVFDGEHLPLATLPGMRERTITISSAGKTFSMTGWKIGWACAPEPLTAALRTVHQFITFCNSAPLQPAMAEALAAGDDFYRRLEAEYRERRDRLCRGLEEVGFGVLAPAGTYFVLADIRPLGWDDDVEFCRMLPEKVGVAAIPPTAFYVNKAVGRHLVRFAFCKTLAVLDEAVDRLHRLSAIRETP